MTISKLSFLIIEKHRENGSQAYVGTLKNVRSFSDFTEISLNVRTCKFYPNIELRYYKSNALLYRTFDTLWSQTITAIVYLSINTAYKFDH